MPTRSHMFVGPHPDTLGDGTPLAIDQIVTDLDLEDPHNARLVEKGWLVEHDTTPAPTPARSRRPAPTEDAE